VIAIGRFLLTLQILCLHFPLLRFVAGLIGKRCLVSHLFVMKMSCGTPFPSAHPSGVPFHGEGLFLIAAACVWGLGPLSKFVPDFFVLLGKCALSLPKPLLRGSWHGKMFFALTLTPLPFFLFFLSDCSWDLFFGVLLHADPTMQSCRKYASRS